jgi:hypothetical protein
MSTILEIYNVHKMSTILEIYNVHNSTIQSISDTLYNIVYNNSCSMECPPYYKYIMFTKCPPY